MGRVRGGMRSIYIYSSSRSVQTHPFQNQGMRPSMRNIYIYALALKGAWVCARVCAIYIYVLGLKNG